MHNIWPMASSWREACNFTNVSTGEIAPQRKRGAEKRVGREGRKRGAEERGGRESRKRGAEERGGKESRKRESEERGGREGWGREGRKRGAEERGGSEGCKRGAEERGGEEESRGSRLQLPTRLLAGVVCVCASHRLHVPPNATSVNDLQQVLVHISARHHVPECLVILCRGKLTLEERCQPQHSLIFPSHHQVATKP